ncbi:hypothetical protein B0A48_14849 [Cryoendolithus antarcticus]|uniref:Pre-mRNA-splicing factor cwf18 n=1 Tax=Cryoendolithus antarcticus TaxID=1507870 RepID=A0A1V8SIS1_9PEZI|nr:hypothetical protein B0A48_14849 [Cryoendolithus antarcticus]
MASVAALGAAAQDRKARLAQLKSLKRKQAPPSDDPRHDQDDTASPSLADDAAYAAPAEDDTSRYVSGRNYDPETKGPRLGFETAPHEGQETLEVKAARLAEETKQQAEADAAADKPLDLFKLQPKKPNWDLKRDLDRKMEVLNVRTDNAIARMVRERIEKQRLAVKEQVVGVNGNSGAVGGDAEAAGIEGSTLVEATNIREREDEADARRELQEDEALLLDAS